MGAFRAALDEKLDLTEYPYEALRAIRGIELRWKPELTVVAFRVSHTTHRDRIEEAAEVDSCAVGDLDKGS